MFPASSGVVGLAQAPVADNRMITSRLIASRAGTRFKDLPMWILSNS
jgi:hypothetical protein